MTFTDPYPTPPPTRRTWSRGALAVGALSLLAGGIAAGAIVASTTGANAETASTTATSAAATSTVAPDNDGDHHGGGHGLDLSGTVTAVGSNSVTIKTSTGTTSYGVTADSDIDKSGEATLADLAVGDAVTFSTTTSGSATVIDKLHAGDETKNHPANPDPTATSTG